MGRTFGKNSRITFETPSYWLKGQMGDQGDRFSLALAHTRRSQAVEDKG